MDAKTVKSSFYSMGADLCGIAPVERFYEAPEGCHPTDFMPDCRSVIVFACRMVQRPQEACTGTAGKDIRELLTEKVNRIAGCFCEYMERKGIAAKAVRTDRRVTEGESGRRERILSARHAAQAAGLGTIGRNSLLITPEYGSMVWLGVVLTEARMAADPLVEGVCGNCSCCMGACPVGALGSCGTDQDACMRYCEETARKGNDRVCHSCRDICPYLYGYRNKNVIAV